MVDWNSLTSEESEISRESTMFDIDRMINEGLGGGNVTIDNGLIGPSTTDTMDIVDESPEIGRRRIKRMEIQRAVEIFNSKDIYKVNLEGSPCGSSMWISRTEWPPSGRLPSDQYADCRRRPAKRRRIAYCRASRIPETV